MIAFIIAIISTVIFGIITIVMIEKYNYMFWSILIITLPIIIGFIAVIFSLLV